MILCVGVLLFGIFSVFVPWKHDLHLPGDRDVEEPAGYALIWNPPPAKAPGSAWGIRIDYFRAALPLVFVVLGTVAIVFALQPSSSSSSGGGESGR